MCCNRTIPCGVEREETMENQKHRMLTVEDIMEALSVSKSSAYTIMREINEDLASKGLRIIPGRVSESHFNAAFFGEDGVSRQ